MLQISNLAKWMVSSEQNRYILRLKEKKMTA